MSSKSSGHNRNKWQDPLRSLFTFVLRSATGDIYTYKLMFSEANRAYAVTAVDFLTDNFTNVSIMKTNPNNNARKICTNHHIDSAK